MKLVVATAMFFCCVPFFFFFFSSGLMTSLYFRDSHLSSLRLLLPSSPPHILRNRRLSNGKAAVACQRNPVLDRTSSPRDQSDELMPTVTSDDVEDSFPFHSVVNDDVFHEI